jgi:hypothetical protein
MEKGVEKGVEREKGMERRGNRGSEEEEGRVRYE